MGVVAAGGRHLLAGKVAADRRLAARQPKSIIHAPSWTDAWTRPATRSASRALPTPPGPVSVNSPYVAEQVTHLHRSASRPMKAPDTVATSARRGACGSDELGGGRPVIGVHCYLAAELMTIGRRDGFLHPTGLPLISRTVRRTRVTGTPAEDAATPLLAVWASS